MSHHDRLEAHRDYHDILGRVFLLWDRFPVMGDKRAVKVNAARLFRAFRVGRY